MNVKLALLLIIGTILSVFITALIPIGVCASKGLTVSKHIPGVGWKCINRQ